MPLLWLHHGATPTEIYIHAQWMCTENLMTHSTQYRNICPPITRPNDFDLFWQQTLGELAQQDFNIQFTEKETRPGGINLQWLTFRSFNGAIIHAYYLSCEDGLSRPLVIHTHGYVGQCDVMWRWVDKGLNIFGFDLRGYGRSHEAITEQALSGYILTGIESAQTSVLRGAICDYVRASEVATQLINTPPERYVFYGHSFAGALALISTALTQSADLLISGVPTLGWAEGRRYYVKNGSGLEINRYLHQHPEQALQVMKSLSYFDTMNFADRIKCPSLIGVGVQDDIVPAPTVYAIINHLKSPHEVREFPVSHSSDPLEKLWSSFESEWINLALNGALSTFGKGSILQVIPS